MAQRNHAVIQPVPNQSDLSTSDQPPLAISLPTSAETVDLGVRLAAALRPGDAVLLIGPLGAGKSALARAAIQALSLIHI